MNQETILDTSLDTTADVIVIGGGPAGLQAALTMGRMHRRAVLLDHGHYRNDPTELMHNLLTHDGRPPAEFRAMARAELATYDSIEVRDVEASGAAAAADGHGFVVTTPSGSIRAKRLLLATGVRDTVPAVPGLEELFGSVVAHCPYCHGHEFAGEHVAILGSHGHVTAIASLLERIAARRTVLTDGVELDLDTSRLLAALDVAVDTRPVTAFAAGGAGAVVSFATGADLEVGGVMVATTFAPSGAFVEQLGLTTLPSGCVEVDSRGRTSVPGVYAAGDVAHTADLPMPMAAVLAAAASGLVAATTIDADAIMARHAELLVTV